MADELPPDGGLIGALLARRLLAGQETPGRLGKSVLSGALELPSAYTRMIQLGVTGANVLNKTAGEAMSAPPLSLLKAAGSDATVKDVTGIADDMQNWARRTAGMPEGPKTAFERAANAGGGALADPLSYIGVGQGAVRKIGMGLLPSVGISVAADAAIGPPEEKPRQLAQAQIPGFTPDIPGFTPDEEPMSDTAKYGLGAAGAIAAGLIAKRAIGPKAAQGRSMLTGIADNAVDQRTSALTPGELFSAVHIDKTTPIRSQMQRSLEQMPPGAGNLDTPHTDVFTTGVPGTDTYGSQYLANLPPPKPIELPAPLPTTLNKQELAKVADETFIAATPENVSQRVQSFKDQGIWTLPDKSQVRVEPFHELVRMEAIQGPEFVEKVQRARALQQQLDAVNFNRQAPIMTGEIGTRNMITTKGGKNIIDEANPGSINFIDEAARRVELAQLMSDPAVGRAVAGMNDIAKTMLNSVAPAYGYPISKIMKMGKQHPNFMPIGEQGKNDAITSWLDRLKTVLYTDKGMADDLSQFDRIMKRSELHGQGVQKPTSIVEEMDQYINTFLHAMERNHAQRTAFYILRNSPDKDIRNSFRVFRGNETGKAPKNTTWFHDGDELIGVHFKDPVTHESFRLNPNYVRYPLANYLRNGFQQGTTGQLNPMFILGKAIAYDHSLAKATRPQGSKDWSGLSGLMTLGHGRVGYDPTAIAQDVVVGAYQVWKSKLQLAASDSITRALASKNPGVWKYYESIKGPGSLRRLGIDLRQAYEDSVYAQLQQAGAVGATQYFERNWRGAATRLEQAVPEWKKLGHSPGTMWSMWNFYKSILEGVAQGPRVRYAMQNSKRPGYKEETRDLLGTFTRRGMGTLQGESALLRDSQGVAETGNKILQYFASGRLGQNVAQAMLDGTPYYNTFVQGTRKVVSRLTSKDGWSSANGLVQTIMLPAAASAYLAASDPEVQEYLRNMPGGQRASMLYFRLPGLPVEQGLHIPVPPEFAMLNAGMAYAVRSMTSSNDGFYQDDIKDAIGQWLGFGMPTPIAATTAAMGFDSASGRGSSFATGSPVDFLSAKPINPEKAIGAVGTARPGAVVPARFEAVMQELMGTFASMVFGMADSVVQTRREGGSAKDITVSAFTHLGNDALRRTPVYKPVHGFHNVAAMSNSKRRLGEKQEIVEAITKAADFMMRDGVTSKAWPQNSELDQGQMPAWAQDPAMRQKMFAVKMLFDRDPVLRREMQVRNAMRRNIEELSGQRPLTRELQQKLNVYRSRELAATERLYHDLKEKEASLGFRLEEIDPRKLTLR